tara:strand:+ start:134367 stop:134807 length:441 start_codon:yes stop_codon:yes gene_type:complete
MKNILKLILTISVFSFFLHLIWEYAQCIPFFNHVKLKPTHQAMLIATLGDVVLTYISFATVSFVKKDCLWAIKPWDKKVIFTLIIVGLILSIGIEIRALNTGRWSYSPQNPLLFNTISVIPVLQLLILFPLTFYLSKISFAKLTRL